MQVPTVQPLPGVEDLYSLLAFLTDPDAVEKRLDEMERVKDEINQMIEKVGKAQDIDRLYIQAQTDRETAGRELEQAREKAKQAMADVDKAAQARQAEYDKQRAQAEADYHKLLAEVNEHSKRNAEQWGKIVAAEDAIRAADKARSAANQKQAELDKLKKGYEDKLEAIRKAAGE